MISSLVLMLGFVRINVLLGKAMFFIEGVGSGYLRIFYAKNRGPPTSWNGLMHDSSEIPKHKHLTLPPPIQDKNNRK